MMDKNVKRFLKAWKDELTMIEFLNERFGYSIGVDHFDDGDAIACPWPVGTIFDKNTPKEDLDLLSEYCKNKELVVFGMPSDVFGKWDHQSVLYSIGNITDVNQGTDDFGFWPAGPCQAGHLPKLLLYKIYKVKSKRKGIY